MSDIAETENKTIRVGLLCATLALIALFVFLFKVNACQNMGNNCHDEFHSFSDDKGVQAFTCPEGAEAEIVTSPPAPKPGVICHCKANVKPAVPR